MIHIETSRLILKSPDKSFGPSLLDFVTRNKDFLETWTPVHHEDFFTLEKQLQILKEKSGSFKEQKEIKLYVFRKEDPDRIIGELEFSNIIKGIFLSCYLGYSTDKDEINKGYMAEALEAAAKYMFEQIGLHRIEANVMPKNNPSIRLLEKLGFENEGLSRKYLKINGAWEDHIHFVLLNHSME